MRSIFCILSVFVLSSGVYAQGLDSCYHTLDELYEFIFDLQSDFPQFVQVDSIGHSRGEMLGHQFPLYSVKISDNVATFEDEPVNLIIAHIHAEEVAGMEATLRFMQKLVTNQEPYRTIRNQTQVYVVPTMNPDGLEVISLGLDNYWRKNGYVPPELHLDSCIVVQGMGEDSCGVDLNRNWDINWIYGDTLFVRENVEPFDYFRGPGPFSEPESRAVRDLALRIKPTVSIVWHSSRSGNVSERCIVAWQWGLDGNAKFAPDCTAIGIVNRGYIGKTIKHPGTQPYLEVIGATRNGALHDWFYRNLGTIQILTETSPRIDIQPTCDSLAPAPNLPGLAQTLIPPMEWLARRLINFPNGNDMQNQGSPVKIHTRNSLTGAPISAEYRILNSWSAILNPWYTNEEHGSATILPPPGTIQVMARKEGFRNDTNTVTVNPGGTTVTTTLELEPLPWYGLNFNVVNESSQAVSADVLVDNGFPQRYRHDVGMIELSKPEGVVHFRVEPLNQNLIARTFHFYHNNDTTVTFTVPTGTVLFSEDFEQGIGNWTAAGGAWRQTVDTTSLNYGICVHTNGPGYRENYGNNLNATFTYNNSLNLTSGNAFHLRFDYRGRLDMPGDSFFVDASVNGTDWQEVRGFSDLEKPWNRVWCDLSPWAGNTNVYVRFRLKTDNVLGDLGIHFDNIQVMGGVDLSSPRNPSPFPTEYALSKVYPNPFNPTTTIAYDAPASGPVEFSIHNVLGQMVWSSTEMPPSPGRYELRWNGVTNGGTQLTSGIYFVRMSAKGHFVGTQKLMFLK